MLSVSTTTIIQLVSYLFIKTQDYFDVIACYFDDGKSYIIIHCDNFIQPSVQLFKFLQR